MIFVIQLQCFNSASICERKIIPVLTVHYLRPSSVQLPCVFHRDMLYHNQKLFPKKKKIIEMKYKKKTMLFNKDEFELRILKNDLFFTFFFLLLNCIFTVLDAMF